MKLLVDFTFKNRLWHWDLYSEQPHDEEGRTVHQWEASSKPAGFGSKAEAALHVNEVTGNRVCGELPMEGN